MDFGDYTYIIIAILFSAIGAISKRRKKAAAASNTNRPAKKSIFEDLFDIPSQEVEDPIAKMNYDDLAFEAAPQHHEHSTQDTPEPSEPLTFSQEVQKKKDESNSGMDKKKTTLRSKSTKTTSIINDIKSPNEVRKAVIYSEILKPKF